MKPEVMFLLENANWPALLVDAASTILRANQAAVKLFGSTLEGGSPLLSAVWPKTIAPVAAVGDGEGPKRWVVTR